MTGIFEDSVLRFEGLSDQDIADLNQILPDLESLITVWQQNQTKAFRVAGVLAPIINKIIAKQRSLT